MRKKSSLTLKTAPVSEPVSLQEAKDWMRVTSEDEDAVISSLISTAREACEEYQGQAYLEQTRILTLDEFPCEEILIPRPPLQSISRIQYLDTAGVQKTIDTVDYAVDSVSFPARLIPAFGKSWPATREQVGAVTIEYVAGYDPDGSPAVPVPQRIKQAILAMVNHLYERPEVAGGTQGVPMLSVQYQDSVDVVPGHIKALLASGRVWET